MGEETWTIFFVSLCSSLVVFVFPHAAFAIEIFFCLFELVFRPRTAEKVVHHIATPIAITCALIRGFPSPGILAILSFGINASNLVVAASKLTYLNRPQDVNKQNLLRLSFFCCFFGRVTIPLIFTFFILKNISLDSNRPDWSRLYATAVLMLLFLNLQLTYNLFVASRLKNV
jgi:hypothetical protein